jgi:hypothetical chaperone protein
MKPIAYGIDFGTTNSVLAVAWPDRTEVLTDRGLPPLRSSVFLNDAGVRTAGEQAVRQFLTNPDTTEARVLMMLKASLAHPRLDATDVFGESMTLERLTSIVFRYLKLLGDRYTGADVTRAFVGFPVAFPDTLGDRFDELQSLAIERLCEAANQAGFTELVPLEEPAAAAGGEDAGLYVALDFGGGTFDVAVVRTGADGDEVLALTGVPVGGERLTALLFEATLERELGLDDPQMPARHRVAARSLPTVLSALFARDFSPSDLRTFAPRYAAIREGGFLWDLYAAVEEAKLTLSTSDHATISLSRSGIVPIEVKVTRGTFERAIAGELDRIMEEVRRALSRAEVSAKDVELVTLTGGSSSIPAFQRRVSKLFPGARVESRDPFGRVALGLAEQARRYRW